MKHSLTGSANLRYESGDPLRHLGDWLAEEPASGSLLLVDFSLSQYWLPEAGLLSLTAIYYREPGGALWVSVTDKSLHSTEPDAGEQYAAWAAEHPFARVKTGEALHLGPVFIAKPWGQEIWFTGVEQRGMCQVEGMGEETPIPWLQAVMPGEDIGACGVPLVLLKILDPSNEPVVGDLYFELHEEKREVYVVTHVDESAWPDGIGYIRFGFDADKRALYKQDDAFRAAYLDAVRNYESVRRQIDATDTEQVTPGLARQELQLRREMDSFTHMRGLRVGDVVKVPLLTPHALQHGVRTIEFQTPVYERKILSFAQKVLTQDHWDTREGVAQMQLDRPTPERFEVLRQEQGIRIERIVDFSDFEVQRITLEDGRSLPGLSIERYGLLMVVAGQLQLGGSVFDPEQALLLPRRWRDSLASAQPAATLVFLLALPRDSAVES